MDMDVNTIKTKINNFWARNIATKPIILSTTERSDAERKVILEKKIILASVGRPCIRYAPLPR